MRTNLNYSLYFCPASPPFQPLFTVFTINLICKAHTSVAHEQATLQITTIMYKFLCLDKTIVEESKSLVDAVSPFLKQNCTSFVEKQNMQIIPLFADHLNASTLRAVFAFYKHEQMQTSGAASISIVDALTLMNSLPSLFGLQKADSMFKLILKVLRNFFKKELEPAQTSLLEIYLWWQFSVEYSVKGIMAQFVADHLSEFVAPSVSAGSVGWVHCSVEFLVAMLNRDEAQATEDDIYKLVHHWVIFGQRTHLEKKLALGCVRYTHLTSFFEHYKQLVFHCMQNQVEAQQLLYEMRDKPKRRMIPQKPVHQWDQLTSRFDVKAYVPLSLTIRLRPQPEQQNTTSETVSPVKPVRKQKVSFLMHSFEGGIAVKPNGVKKGSKNQSKSKVSPKKKKLHNIATIVQETESLIHESEYQTPVSSSSNGYQGWTFIHQADMSSVFATASEPSVESTMTELEMKSIDMFFAAEQ